MEQTFCPHCGHDVTAEEETEYGIFCPNCHNDFWRSETIAADEIGEYTHYPEYNMMLRPL